MKVIEINYGTGNRVGEVIYINKDLKKYPGLYEAVLEHEKKHTGTFKWSDVVLDLFNEDIRLKKKDWLRFLRNHPKSWINFFPLIRLGGVWTFDLSIFLVWTIMILLFILGWSII